MPLIDVIYAQGSLNADAQQKLTNNLWATALRWEGIELSEAAASVAWVYLDERPRHHVTVAGHPASQNIYRINVRVMVGFMDQERINRLAAELTEAILEADGTGTDGSGPRVFCIVEEIPSGTWSIDGKTWTTVFTARTLGLDSSRIEAMEQALATRPRIDVPHVVQE
ncbi:tautomerase family protein [Paraburkholderia sp. GAS348]|jgi:phenylpyruvate tautomerase PptA (4-oxalocrotonate tautomerase family)|uniref:tautomerase family protein n=1 Tax=Paraburkholderia sp. GAS348 TaxID=3035132 RepID=UPI003D1AB232